MTRPIRHRHSHSPSAGRRRTCLRCARNERSDDGISLVEVLVAFVILMIAIVPLSYMLDSAVADAAGARQREAALQLADSWIEILSNSTPPLYTNPDGTQTVITNSPQPAQTPAGVAAPISNLAGTTYTVLANYTEQPVNSGSGQTETGQSDLCTTGTPPSPSHPGVIVLQVTVTWDNGNETLTDSTNIEYPQPGVQTDGYLAITVSTTNSLADVNGNTSAVRLGSIPVTLTDISVTPNTYVGPLYPDDNGCIFAQLPTGTYNIAVGQPATAGAHALNNYTGTPPFVTSSGVQTDTVLNQQVQVISATYASLNVFDEGINSTVTYGSSTAVDDGVECPGTSVITCVTTGNGSSTASAAWGGSGSAWSSTTIPTVTRLASVACTTAAKATCVGVGYSGTGSTASGVIETTSSSFSSPTSDPVPTGVTDISQVTCPTNNGCYALGTQVLLGVPTPVLLAGAVGQTAPNADKWAIITAPGTTFTSLSSIACPSSLVCELSGMGIVGVQPASPGILRLAGDPAGLATTPTWTPTITADTLPNPDYLTSVGQITCPSATTCEVLGVGTSASATAPTILTGAITATGTWSYEIHFHLPTTGTTAVTGISCAGTTCVAIGSNTTTPVAPVIWEGSLTGTNHSWTLTAITPSLAAVSASAVSCGTPATGDSADCAVAVTTSSSTAPGQIVDASLSSLGSWTWNSVTIPGATAVNYFSGVGCEAAATSAQATCAAVGATANGPIIATTANGPAGTWSISTPTSSQGTLPLPGSSVNGIPLETQQGSAGVWTTQVAAVTGQSNASSLPVLFPEQNGYSIVAGDCGLEATTGDTNTFGVNVNPGGTANAIVPLGVLPLEVLTPITGAPLAGAVVKITATTTGCLGDSYTMPTSGPDGLTRSAVPYGQYSYTVTPATGTPTTGVLAVGASAVSVGASTFYLPGPGQVTG
ncbi:MAG: hypothetical protein ACLQOZ_08890 [Acidimicrobiales bacterium]